MGNVMEVGDGTFEQEVLHADQPVLVDFWAPWCGPCRMIAPVIEELSNDNIGTAKVVKVNIDDNPMLAQNYDVQSIPTLMLFKNGTVVERAAGIAPKARLQSWIDSHRSLA